MSSHPPSRHQLCTSRIPPSAFWNEIYTYILYEAIKTASPNLNYIKYLFCDKIVLFYFILLYVCLSLCAFIHFHFTFSRQKRKILHFLTLICWSLDVEISLFFRLFLMLSMSCLPDSEWRNFRLNWNWRMRLRLPACQGFSFCLIGCEDSTGFT